MHQFGGSLAPFRFGPLPNPALHSDPACIVFRSLSASRFLDFVQRLGAGGAGELHSLGVNPDFASTRPTQIIISVL